MLGFIFLWLDHFPYFDTSDSLFSLISFHRILYSPDFPSPSLMFLLDLLYDLFSLFLYVKWHFPWVLSLALSPLFFILNTTMHDCITAYYFSVVDGFPKNLLSLTTSKKVMYVYSTIYKLSFQWNTVFFKCHRLEIEFTIFSPWTTDQFCSWISLYLGIWHHEPWT